MHRHLGPCLPKGQFILSACLGRQSKGRGDEIGYSKLIDSILRAADALHLAVAALGGHALATLDARLAEGAQAVGVRVVGV